MLSEEEKKRISAEEIYRDELRSQLSQAKSRSAKSRFWTLVNSSIFLWFLSTVAVGGITYLWTVKQNEAADNRMKAQKAREAEEAKRVQINKLNLEIEGRLSQFIVGVERMVERFDEPIYQSPYRLKPGYSRTDIFTQWNIMKAPPSAEKMGSSVYPEFVDRGIISLIVEVDKLRHEFDPNAKRLQSVIASIQSDAIFDDAGKGSAEFLPVWEKFHERVIREEWRTTFPYTDCSRTFPFC